MPTPQLRDEFVIKFDGTALTTDEMNNLVRVEVEQGVEIPSMCRLVFHDETTELMSSSKIDIGNEILIQAKNRHNQRATEIFKGEIVAIEPEYTEELFISVCIIAFDKLHRLNRGRKTRTFLESTDSDVIKKIIQEAGLQERVCTTSYKNKYIAQDNVSDLAFIQMLAHRNGFGVTYNANMIVVDKLDGSTAGPTLVVGETLRYFRPHMSITNQVQEVIVQGWDPKTKREVIGRATSSTTHPTIGYSKSGIEASRSLGNQQLVETSSQVLSQELAQKIAEARLGEINAGFIQGEGRTFGDPSIKPGVLVTLQGLGLRFNGKYMVTVARHTYKDGLYETEFMVEGQRAQLVSDMLIPHNDPPRVWNGVVPAVVTNTNDPDNMGRVKVKFPWLSGQDESNWARVVSAGAGPNRGLLNIPEVNDEVLVAFENGYFGSPYVVGGLWNGQDATPSALSEYRSSNAIIVRSWTTRTGHKLVFTEKSDQSTVVLEEKDGIKLTLDGTKKKIELLNGGLTITMDAQGQKITINAGTGNIEMKGTNITVEATGQLALKATGTTEIKGAMVNIN